MYHHSTAQGIPSQTSSFYRLDQKVRSSARAMLSELTHLGGSDWERGKGFNYEAEIETDHSETS